MIRRLKKLRRQARHLWAKHVDARLFRGRSKRRRLRLVVGASGWYDRGWVPSDREYLDLTKPADWERWFQPNTIDAILAEHVLEHLYPSEAKTAVQLCFTYLKPGGYWRLAVPDGFHPDPVYLRAVGTEFKAHKVLYTYQSLSDLLRGVGFKVKLYEYFNENGAFHYSDWDPRDGKIRRSVRYDSRNRRGNTLRYTSIILDAVKPHAPAH